MAQATRDARKSVGYRPNKGKGLSKNQRRALRAPVQANRNGSCFHSVVVYEEVRNGEGKTITTRYSLWCQVKHTFKKGKTTPLQQHKVHNTVW